MKYSHTLKIVKRLPCQRDCRTKYVTIDRAKEAYDVGLRHFGENRLEGFLEKKSALPNDVTMHFIGSYNLEK